ncbi:inversin-like [Haliotis asinina]|uniref:inversin-like n=1 Tax=Haliotis asinina TaxID=109174 RepID=UPI0035323E24
MLAAENGHKDAVKFLVDKGVDVSLVDKRGENILHCACKGGHVKVVECILSRKMVEIDSLAHSRKTPVILAGEQGHKEAVESLVKYGADLSLRDKRRNNVLYYASEKGHLGVVKYIISLHKININSRGFEMKTPVMLAGYSGHIEVVCFS